MCTFIGYVVVADTWSSCATPAAQCSHRQCLSSPEKTSVLSSIKILAGELGR